MAFVADASVTAAWFIAAQANSYADRLLDRLAEEQAYVPSIWPAEFTNIFLVLERRRKLKPEQVQTILRLASHYPITVDIEAVPLEKIYRIIRQYGLTAYDAMYLELALRLGLPLCTQDSALGRAASKAGLSLE
jgi:predicted nucleic acid-binding protein